LLALTAIVVALTGLLISTKLEKAQTGGGIILLLIVGYPLVFSSLAVDSTPFPALRAIAPARAIFELLGVGPPSFHYRYWIAEQPGRFFGLQVHWVVATIILQSVAIFWLVRMLLRAIKRNAKESQLFLRLEGIAFIAFMDLLFFACLDPGYKFNQIRSLSAADIVSMLVILNLYVLPFVAMVTIPSAELQKIWHREKRKYLLGWFDDKGPLFVPVLVGAAISCLMLFVYALGLHRYPLAEWDFQTVFLRFAVLAAFISRDMTFLQWCNLTRMRWPAAKGVMLLGLYYVAAFIITASMGFGTTAGETVLVLLTPAFAIDTKVLVHSGGVVGGVLLQSGITAAMLVAIARRFSGAHRATIKAAA